VSRRRPTIALWVLLLVAVSGCAPPPLRPPQIRDPDLRVIRNRYQEIVAEAHRDPEFAWHAGPIGNFVVNFVGVRHVGLCYDWQELIYDELLPTVQERGWELTGIKINEHTEHEHHAVIVFDPRRVEAEAILAAPDTATAWVLEPWRRGRADIYRVSDWLALARQVHAPAELEELPYVPPEDHEVSSTASATSPGPKPRATHGVGALPARSR